MPLYEHVFLVRPDVGPQQVEELTVQATSILESNGAKIVKSEYWGLKTLSFRMNKSRKAHYTMLIIEGPHPAVAEMERQLRINEDVIRFLTLRIDEVDPEPSVMMQKKDRDDRRDRERMSERRPREEEEPVVEETV